MQDEITARDADGAASRLADREAELKRVTALHEAAANAAASSRHAAAESSKARDAAAAALEEHERESAAALRAADAQALELGDLAQTESQLEAKLAELERQCRDLGALPGNALDKYRSLSHDALLAALKKVAVKLGKYSTVNQRALDEFAQFGEKHEQVAQRRQVCVTSEVISSLYHICHPDIIHFIYI